MELKTRLKVSSVNNLTDARYFAATGAEWIGFNFNPESPRAINTEEAKEIMDWLSGPRFLGEFDGQKEAWINQVCKELNLDTIQTDIDLNLAQLDSQIQGIIHRIKIEKNTTAADLEEMLEERQNWTSQFLLDFTTAEISWEDLLKEEKNINDNFLEELCQNHNVLIKLKFTKDNVLEVIEKLQPMGIVLQGGNEIITGMQLFEEVDPIMEMLEVEE